MQILNIHDTHWICITNIDFKANEVKVYDSMCTGDIPMKAKRSCCVSSKAFSDIHIPNISRCPTTSWQFRLWPVLTSVCIAREVAATSGSAGEEGDANEMDISSGDEMLSQAASCDAVESSSEKVS